MTAPMPDQEPQAHSELASFGEELRREREIRGISLKEIADATKISKRFLEAIERNDHRTLPAPVFTRGFVREYARYLGLNAEEMVNRYNFAAAGDDRIEKSAHLERLVQPPAITGEPPKKKGIPPVYARVDANVYILILIVAALVGVSWWAIQHKRNESEAMRESASAAVTTAPVEAPKPVPQTDTAPPASTEPAPLKLTLELTDDSWIDLEADGQTVMKDEYRRGTRETFEAKDGFRFKRIGNAAGVLLILNDKEIPPLGRDGQVIKNRVFDRAYLDKMNVATTTAGVQP
jgi:cytoskeletal protein RodZ